MYVSARIEEKTSLYTYYIVVQEALPPVVTLPQLPLLLLNYAYVIYDPWGLFLLLFVTVCQMAELTAVVNFAIFRRLKS